MNSKEMYEASRSAAYTDCGVNPSFIDGLPIRLVNALERGMGKDDFWVEEDRLLNWVLIREKVLSGEIWLVRDIGKTRVKQLCEWIEKKEAGEL